MKYPVGITSCSPIMKYNGQRHARSVPKRSNEHITDKRTREYVTSQTVCKAKFNLIVVLKSPGVKYDIGFPHP